MSFLRFLLSFFLYIKFAYSSEEAIIEADNISHDHIKNQIFAKGNVLIKHNLNKLYADEIFYDLNSNIISASGKVMIKNSQNDYIQADYIKTDHKLEKAQIKNLEISSQQNMIKADKAEKLDNNYKLNKVFYSSCNFCHNLTPEWHIQSKQADYDSEKQRIKYKNIIFYVKKLPIIYLPYLSHSTDPNNFKSGLSLPKFNSYNNGTIILPIYLPISENEKFIYKPAFSSSENIIHNIKYSQLLNKLNFRLNLSFVKSRKNSPTRRNIDYFLDSKFGFELNENCKIGGNVDNTSNIAYKNTYNFGKDSDYLTQNLYLNLYRNLDYLSIDYLSFQNLKGDITKFSSPLIAPLIEIHKEFNLGKYGKQIIEINYMDSYRTSHKKRQRLILKFEWLKNFVTHNGHIFDFSHKIRNDFYKFSKDTSANIKYIKRNLADFSVKWRYPLIKTSGSQNFIIEPISKLFLSAGKDKNNKIPEEDSIYRELSHLNLFSDSQYDGLDKIENVSKFIYGINSIIDLRKSRFNLMIGQIIYLGKTGYYNSKYDLATGSNLLMKFNYDLMDQFSLKYKAKFDHTHLKNKFDEFSVNYKLRSWNIYYDYASFNSKNSDNIKLYKFGSSKTISNVVNLYAETGFSASSKLKPNRNAKIIYYKIGSKYTSECSTVKFSVKRDYSENIGRNKKPNTIFSFGLRLNGLN